MYVRNNSKIKFRIKLRDDIFQTIKSVEISLSLNSTSSKI
jgi:hypothetical protein